MTIAPGQDRAAASDRSPGLKRASGHARELSLMAGLACVTVIGLAFRPPIISMGPLLNLIRHEFGLTHAEAALLTSIPDFLMGVLAAPAPALARRFGRDKVILTALIVLVISLSARAFVTSTTALMITTFGAGAGVAVAGALVGGFIKATFPQRAPLLIGVYSSGLAIGATLAGALSGPVAEAGTWRLGAGMWAAPAVAAIGAWIFVEGRQRHERKTNVHPHRLPFTHPKAWLIGLFYAADNFLFYAIAAWVAPMFHERGTSETTAGLILASFTGTFPLANFIVGIISRRRDRRHLLAALSALALAGLLALALAPDMAPFVVLPVIAFGVAGGFTLGMALPLDNTSNADAANAWSAFVLLVAYVCAASGPLLVGAIRDATGSFNLALWMLVAAGVLMLGLTPFLGPVPEGEAAA